MIKKDFSFFSIGGIGEIGLNCYVLTISGESFIIDMGLDFPDNGSAGIGVILPDITFIKKHLTNVRGIIFTHGHDDHIGAFPYYSDALDVPVYASSFAAELIKQKLKEMEKPPINKLTLITSNNKSIKIGSHIFNFFETKHSIPQSYGFYVETPFGNIIFTSDYKDIPHISSLPRKPFILFTDSTNIESENDVAEEDVEQTLKEIFANAKGAIVATTFSSHIERIGLLLTLAQEFEKEIFIVGKNIENAIMIAKRLKLIALPQLNHWEKINKVPREKIFVMTTGSQGERFSSLSLLSKGSYRGFEIKRGDTIIVSSSMIPGNEVNIYRMINRFAEKEADVFYTKVAKVHSSGHGSHNVLKKVLKAIKPQFVVPIHGEARHLVAFKRMALKLGYDEDRIILLRNGLFLEGENFSVSVKDGIEVERVLLDEGGYVISKSLLRERMKLSENGLIYIELSDYQDCSVEVDTVGLVVEEEKMAFERELKEVIKAEVNPNFYRGSKDRSLLKEAIAQVARAYIKRRLNKKPLVKVMIRSL